MDLSRRKFIQSGVVISGAVALTDFTLAPGAYATGGPAAPAGTTLAATLGRGNPGPGGYTPVIVKPGEAHSVRTDLVANPGATRETTRSTVLTFAHMTDVHLIDEQSPMR